MKPLSRKISFDSKKFAGVVFVLLLWTSAVLLTAVFITYSPNDPGPSWDSTVATVDINNFGGKIGAAIVDGMSDELDIVRRIMQT